MGLDTLYYAGNPYIPEDTLALKVAELLKKEFPQLNFMHIGDTFQLLDKDFENAIILDVADSIEKVSLLNSKEITSGGNFSAHDFDIGSFFEITGKESRIIGIPLEYNLEKAVFESSRMLNQLLN